MTRKDKRVLEAEKEIMDIIPRFKGAHMKYLCEGDYHSIRLLHLLANKLHDQCNIIETELFKEQRERESYDRG